MLGFSEAHSQKQTASNRVLPFRAVANISLLLAIHSLLVQRGQSQTEMKTNALSMLLCIKK